MLQLHSPKTRYAFEKAAHAREKARTAADPESRVFWQDMEAKWLHFAESTQFVEQPTNT